MAVRAPVIVGTRFEDTGPIAGGLRGRGCPMGAALACGQPDLYVLRVALETDLPGGCRVLVNHFDCCKPRPMVWQAEGARQADDIAVTPRLRAGRRRPVDEFPPA